MLTQLMSATSENSVNLLSIPGSGLKGPREVATACRFAQKSWSKFIVQEDEQQLRARELAIGGINKTQGTVGVFLIFFSFSFVSFVRRSNPRPSVGSRTLQKKSDGRSDFSRTSGLSRVGRKSRTKSDKSRKNVEIKSK